MLGGGRTIGSPSGWRRRWQLAAPNPAPAQTTLDAQHGSAYWTVLSALAPWGRPAVMEYAAARCRGMKHGCGAACRSTPSGSGLSQRASYRRFRCGNGRKLHERSAGLLNRSPSQ